MKKSILWILSTIIYLNVSAHELPQLAKTPPMGWNSWDCFGMDINESQMKATADYMAKNLKKFGWNYIVLDMGWNYGDSLNTNNFRMKNPPLEMDRYGRLIPNVHKFPSSAGGKGLKPLADYVHSLGLKFGIHIMRGIPWQAVEKNIQIKGTLSGSKRIATDANKCKWFNGMLTVDMTKPGAQEYYNSLLEIYADWGVDYIKADDLLRDPYHGDEIEAIHKAIQKIGRPIVLSLSAGPLPVEKVGDLRQNANLWRLSGDMWDDWKFIIKTFDYCRTWQNYVVINHWPDCDILPLGKLRINGTDGALAKAINKKSGETVNEYSRLSNDEKYTLMTLWTIFRSPLMIGGNLLDMDQQTLNLLTNKEVLAVNQKSCHNHEFRASESEIIWVAEEPGTRARYLALFNVDDKEPKNIIVRWNELGISGKYTVRDLWKKENIGTFSDNYEIEIMPHGCALIKISK